MDQEHADETPAAEGQPPAQEPEPSAAEAGASESQEIDAEEEAAVVARSAFAFGSARDVAPPKPAPALSLTRVYLTSAGIAAAVSLFAAAMFFAGFYVNELLEDDESKPAAAVAAAQNTGEQAAARPTVSAYAEVSVDDDPARGPDDAKVTIIEFSDFQCPYCARFHAQTLPRILDEYGDQIRFVYRDFPLENIHPRARPAAIAAECADDQGKFWEYHDLLFTNQTALDDASLKGYASQLGLDNDDFASCYDAKKHDGEVSEDLSAGLEVSVTGTPTFFINGRRVVGAQAYETFKAIIDEQLAE